MNRKAYASIFASLFLTISFLTGCSSSTPPTVAIAASAGTPQSAQINQPYSSPLSATVTSNGTAVGAGVSVVFTAPASGASGTFSGGSNTETDMTNGSGVATSSTFTANSTAGAVAVSATTASASTPAAYTLTNTSVPTFAFYGSGIEVGPNFYTFAGSVGIDVLGNVTGGELDFNDGAGNTSPGEPTTPDTITATPLALVTTGFAGQYTLALTTSNTNLGVAGVITLGVQFVNSNHALITQFDGTATSSGSLDLQTIAPISASAGFAVTLNGVDPNYAPLTMGGVFKTDTTGTTITSGVFDDNDDGVVTTGTVFPAGVTISAPDPNGRGTITNTGPGLPTTIAYYIVGPEVLRLIGVDVAAEGGVTDAVIGSAFGQGTATFTNGAASTALASSVFGVLDTPWNGLYGALGSFVVPPTPTGNFLGIADNDEAGDVFSGVIIGGSYTISNSVNGTAYNGYSNLQITTANLGDVTNLGLYLTDPTLNLEDPNNSSGQAAATAAGALVVDLDPGLTGSGVLIPQTNTAPGDFTGSASSYAFGGQAFGNFGEIDFAGVGGFTAGAFSGTGLLSDPFFGFGANAANAGVTFTGAPLADTTPAESTTGRYTMFTFNTTPNPLVVTEVAGAPVDFDVVIYQASGTQAFMLNEDEGSVFLGPIEQQGATVNPLVKKRAAKAAKTKRK
jgi:hypothetical protein